MGASRDLGATRRPRQKRLLRRFPEIFKVFLVLFAEVQVFEILGASVSQVDPHNAKLGIEGDKPRSDTPGAVGIEEGPKFPLIGQNQGVLCLGVGGGSVGIDTVNPEFGI